ncbi:MAG: 5'-3' exonuclease [Candidatus Phosphoribacter sp.]|nr:5'-3' exonuclease [Actinomycetales bacterium]
MTADGRLLLLDSASLYFRAFYGVPDQRETPAEPPTNAVRGFLDMLSTLIDRHRPTHLAACWDNDWRPQFRVQAIPTYKSHRLAPGSDPNAPGGVAGAGAGSAAPGATTEEAPDDLAPQVPVIGDALRAVGLARIGVDGYEADDVIGALADRYAGRLAIDVVTGDRDLFQLVDDTRQVRVVYTARGGVRDPDLVDQAYLAQRYGVPDGAAYADFAVLRGDPSDGLPGVAGIGEKSAAALLVTFGSLAGIRAAVDGGDPRIKGAQRTRLEAGTAYLDVAPRVVHVATDAPLPEHDLRLPTAVADPVLLSRLAVDYGLTNPFNRLLGALGLG